MADATELAVAYISLLPSLRDFPREVERSVGGLGASVGADFGRDFARAAQRSAGPDIKRLAANLDAAASQEADALGKVRVAQAKLNEARAKGATNSARAITAEENLAKASRDLATAQGRAKTAAEQHAAAEKTLATGADKAGDQLDDVAGSARKARTEVSKAGKESKESGGKIRGAFSGLGRAFAPLLALGAGAGAISLIRGAGEAASDLSETGTKVVQVFGKDGAAALDKFAQGSDQALGQTKQQVLDASATFGVFGKSAGLAGTDLTGFSTEFVKLSTDLASFHNANPEDVIEALGSGLRGEAEPLRKYGILLDDATLRQEAMKQGLIKTTKQALTPQQKVLAAHALILAQTKDAQGDFAKTGDGLANTQRKATAAAGELKREFGELLLPIFLKGANLVNQKVIPALRAFVQGYKDGTGAGGAFRGVVQFIVGVVTRLSGVFRGDASPAVSGLAGTFGRFGAVVLPIVRSIIERFRKEWPVIKPIVVDTMKIVKSIIADVMTYVQFIIDKTTKNTSFIWKHWGKEISFLAVNAFRTVVGIIRGALNIVGGIIKVFTGLMTGDFHKAGEGVKQIFRGLMQVVKSILVGGLKALLTVVGKIIGKDLVSKFDEATRLIGAAWDKIKEKAKAPIRFVIDTVLEGGILAAFRKIGGLVGINTDAFHVSLPPGFHEGSPGAVVPGRYDPAHRDNVLALTGAGRPIARVEPGEMILPRWMSPMFGYLDGIRRSKSLPGYAGGGLVGGSGRFTDRFASILSQAQKMLGLTFHIFQRGFRPATSYSGTSHQGDAVDIAPAGARALRVLRSLGVAIWDRTGKGNWAPHYHGVPLPGYGSPAGSAIWQGQDYLRGGDGLGGRDNGPRTAVGKIAAFLKSGFTSFTDWFKGLVKAPLGKLDQVGGGALGQIVSNLPRILTEGLRNKLTAFDTGHGTLQPGWTLAYNGTGQPEYLATAARWRAGAVDDQGGGRSVSGHMVEQYFPASMDPLAAAAIAGDRAVASLKSQGY